MGKGANEFLLVIVATVTTLSSSLLWVLDGLGTFLSGIANWHLGHGASSLFIGGLAPHEVVTIHIDNYRPSWISNLPFSVHRSALSIMLSLTLSKEEARGAPDGEGKI